MLTIEIKVNGRLIGGATATNASSLAEYSDYKILAVEKGDQQLQLTDYRQEFAVKGHLRQQSCWALVRQIADLVCNERTP